MKTKTLQARIARLMPGGVPRYVRCYDNGGPDMPDGSCDRYTVVFSGRAASAGNGGEYPYLAMSGSPFHPQGFGQHGSTRLQPCDTMKHTPGRPPGYCWPPAIGRKCHLGTRIRFQDLPPDCQKLVLSDYKEIWRLNS
jgi:hypothetical protein